VNILKRLTPALHITDCISGRESSLRPGSSD
jgi:hypothetical protein